MEEIRELKAVSYITKTRLSEAEYQAFMLVLLRLGTTRCRMLRKMVRELIGMGPDLLASDLRTFREAIYQVGAVGRNLNQLVRLFHGGRLPDVQVDGVLLERIREQVTSLEKELLAVVKRSRYRWVHHG